MKPACGLWRKVKRSLLCFALTAGLLASPLAIAHADDGASGGGSVGLEDAPSEPTVVPVEGSNPEVVTSDPAVDPAAVPPVVTSPAPAPLPLPSSPKPADVPAVSGNALTPSDDGVSQDLPVANQVAPYISPLVAPFVAVEDTAALEEPVAQVEPGAESTQEPEYVPQPASVSSENNAATTVADIAAPAESVSDAAAVSPSPGSPLWFQALMVVILLILGYGYSRFLASRDMNTSARTRKS